MEKYLPVVVIRRPEETAAVLAALKSSGFRCAEITFRTACAAQAIADARRLYPDMLVGAGTVINVNQCRQALRAGAQFVVSPGLSAGIARLCRRRRVPYYPGCVTPTEIIQALALGLTTVKFFPAGVFGGVAALKALSAPFPQVQFIPTGGVDRSNIDEYLAFDRVVSVGGSFFVREALEKAQEKAGDPAHG